MISYFSVAVVLAFLNFIPMVQATVDPEVQGLIEKIQGVTIDLSKSRTENRKQIKKLSRFLREYSSVCLEKGQNNYLYKYLVSPPYEFEVRDSSLRGFPNAIAQVDENSIAIGFIDNTIGIFNIATAEREVTLFDHGDRISALSVLKSGHLVSGSDDGVIMVWEPKTYKKHLMLNAHSSAVLSIVELEGQSLIATASADGTIKFWNMNGVCERVLVGNGFGVSSLVQLDEKRFASASWDYTVKIWDIDEGVVLNTFEGHDDFVNTLAQVNDTTLASGSDDGSLIIWDIPSGSCVHRMQENCDWLMSSCRLANGLLATSFSNGFMFIFNPLNGVKIARFVDPCLKRNFSVSFVMQLRNGNIVALSDDKILRLLECYTDEIQRVFAPEGLSDNCYLIALIIGLEKAFKTNASLRLEDSWIPLFNTIPSSYRKNYSQILKGMVLSTNECVVM